MGGWGFYKDLKDNQNFCEIPIIVYTAIYHKSETRPDPRDYGDTLYTMPIDITDLRNQARELGSN